MANDIKKTIKFGIDSNVDLVLSTSSLPFGNRTGAVINMKAAVETANFPSDRFPGIMCLDLVPTIGRTNTAINTVMGKLYARLIRKISGAKDIEKVDQFMYLECGKSLVDMIAKLKTVYHLSFLYKEHNLYWPKSIIKAYGFNPDDIVANLEDFRAWINRFITRVRSLNFPNIAYLKSGWEYARTILLDSPDITRAQLYITNIKYAYKWDPISDPNGTKLVVVNIGDSSTSYTFATVRQLYDGIVDELVYDQDAIDISAWYDHLLENESDKLAFTDCTQDMDHVQYAYDIEALTVIENAEYLPDSNVDDNTTFDIYQLSNMALQGMGWSAYATQPTTTARDLPNIMHPHVLNVHKPKPSPKDIARYMSFKYQRSYYMSSWPSTATIYVDNTSDYVPQNIKFFYMTNSNGTGTWVNYKDFRGDSTASDILKYSSYLSQFIHKPQVWPGTYIIVSSQFSTSGGKYVKYFPQIKFDNYLNITEEILDNLYTAVWYTNLEDK